MSVWTRIKTWAQRGALFLLVLVVMRTGWHVAFGDDARAILNGGAERELVARRDYLAAQLDAEAVAPVDSQFAGEWAIVTLSMTAAGAAGIGFDYPATVPEDLTLTTHAVQLANEPRARAFDTARWGGDALDALESSDAHIGYLGHFGIALEAYRLLGGKDKAWLALEKRVADALARRVQNAKFPYVPTYPGETYVADNAVVLAVIALSDVGRSAAHAPLLARAITHARAHLVDPTTGLLDFAVGDDGEAKGGPRASGAAWSIYYLAFVDEAFALEQAKALRAYRKKLWPGAEAICERTTCDGQGDVDSGPLLLGTSPAASGFAIAAARRLFDVDWLSGLLSTAEWVGVTVPGARRHYLIAPRVGDAIVLAMKTSRGWDDRYLH